MSPVVQSLAALALLATPTLARHDAQGQAVDRIDPRVWCLHEGANGDLWFGTNGAGVFRLRDDRLTQFTKAHGLTGNEVRSVQGDGRGGVLVTANGAVARCRGESFTPLKVVEHSGTDGWRLHSDDVWLVLDPGTPHPCRFDGTAVHQLELTESKADVPPRPASEPGWRKPYGVYRVTRDRRGHVWIGTAEAGLCRYDGTSIDWMYEARLTRTPQGGEFGIRSIFQDRSGDFWICNTRQRFDIEVAAPGEQLRYSTRPGLPSAATDDAANLTYFPSIAEDDAGALWLACGSDGVLCYADERVTRHPLAEGAYAMSLLVDRAGTTWVGTLEHGAFRFAYGEFRPFAGPPTAARGTAVKDR